MAVTTFTNVKTVDVQGETVLQPTSVDFNVSASPSTQTVDGGLYASILNVGATTVSATVNGNDPGLTSGGLFAGVLGTSGVLTFVMTAGCDGTGTSTLTLADGVGDKAVAESFEFDSGGPGETGTCSAGFQVVGITSSILDAYSEALVGTPA